VLISVVPGDVVWVLAKGSPPWPALVITSEEATDFSIAHGHTRAPQVRSHVTTHCWCVQHVFTKNACLI
jgi:hypothetical protein